MQLIAKYWFVCYTVSCYRIRVEKLFSVDSDGHVANIWNSFRRPLNYIDLSAHLKWLYCQCSCINVVRLYFIIYVLWAGLFCASSGSDILSRYVTSHPDQLSLVIPSWIGAMSTSQRAVTPCGWGVKAGMDRYGWQVKLVTHNPLVTHWPYLST